MQVIEAQKEGIYTKDNPYAGLVVERRRLTLEGSSKDTQHVVVDISGAGLDYSCGDSLGVYPENDPVGVQLLLDSYGFSGFESVVLPKTGEGMPLRDALTCKLSLAGPTRKFLVFLRERVSDEREMQRLESLLSEENAETLKEYLYNREFMDLGREYPSARIEAQELVDFLKKLVPRMYSIASSPMVYPNEVHLTVAVVRYQTNELERIGVATTYLADRLPVGAKTVPVFLAKSHFGMPEDSQRDMIMVGPGTGVAPYRGFMQEHVAKGRVGRTWLFFGEQHKATDYLYQDDWERWLAAGKLNCLDLAFSRDQKEKVYVQDKMREKADDLWRWIDGGANFYVCGDAKRMAKDVETELLNIFESKGNMSGDEARNYLKEMKREKRYQKDVY